jgi:hypothetical protein
MNAKGDLMDESKHESAGGSRSGSRRSTTGEPQTTTGSSMPDPNASPIATETRRAEPGAFALATDADEGIIDRVKSRAAAQLTTQKDRATDGMGSVANAVRRSTQELRDQHHETVAEYVERAADQLDRFSSRLKSKDVGELMRDAQDLARRQPMLFIGSALVLGFAGARFLKSSSPDRREQGSWKELGGPRPPYGGGTSAGMNSTSALTGSASQPRYAPSPTESRVRPATERDTRPSVGWETR